MAKRPNFVFVVTKERPDFIGRLVQATGDFVVLENPAVVEYLSDLTVAFNTDFLPIGMPPRYDRMFKVTIPVGCILYYVTLNDDDKMVKSFQEQMSVTPEELSAVKAAELTEAEGQA